MISREKLENQQIGLYAAALLLGGMIGLLSPGTGSALHAAVSPILAVLLYSMFVQIPFLQLREAVSNGRFIGALLITNFIIVPIVVWLLTQLFPQSPPVLVGVYLVLLTPCIDYVIVFTQLGRGNEKLMLVATPVLFAVQMIMLPFYLWLFMGNNIADIVKMGPFAEAFIILIVLPLGLAICTQLWAKHRPGGKSVMKASAWLPVPFMALALLIVVASQIGKVYSDLSVIIGVVPLYLLFHLVMPLLARMVAAFFRLDPSAGRTLIFSTGTRNSLVVLPLAMALPGEWAAIAAAVIVTQTIIELVAELIYIRTVPALIMRER